MRVIELFGGIGACTKALERLGIDVEIVDYVEIDKFAVKSFNAMHGTNFEPQDICEWDKDVADVDLIMHGSPCQDFSVAGLQAGGDEGSGTRSSLMFETVRIVEKIKPKYVIWENVRNVLSKRHRHNFDAYLEKMGEIGYRNHYKILNSKNYGIPQNRERVFVISIRSDIDKNFEFPQEIELKLRLKDLLDDGVDNRFYLSGEAIERMRTTTYTSGKYENRVSKSGEIIGTLCARDYKDPKCVEVNDTAKSIRLGGIFDKEGERHQAGSIYDRKGLSPALDSGQGGWRQPLIEEENNCLKVKNATKKGYLEAYEGDYINIQFPNSKTRRGRVGKQLANTLLTSDENCVVTTGPVPDKYYLSDKMVDYISSRGTNGYSNKDAKINLDVARPLTECPNKRAGTTNYISKELPEGYDLSQMSVNKGRLRIRKLTPKECWRLMGFDDEDFEKARQVNSDTQLYKQAGNSIVVNVLEAIFRNLFEEEL